MGCWGRSHCRLALWGRDSLPARPWVAPAQNKAFCIIGPLGPISGSSARPCSAAPPVLQNKMFCASARRGEIPPPLGLPSPFRAGEPAPRAVRAGRLTPLGAAPPRYHSRHDRRKDQAERVASLRHAAAMMYGNHRGHGPLIARYYLRQHTIMCNMYI